LSGRFNTLIKAFLPKGIDIVMPVHGRIIISKKSVSNHHKRKVDNLSRLMSCILGKRPDEFGLVPDREGYIPLKEFLKAVKEEPLMGYIREFHVRETLLKDKEGIFEIQENKIRSTKRDYRLIFDNQDFNPPKILYRGVKRKTYPSILKYGLLPGSGEYVVMTKDRDFAVRIASRLDQEPIILEIRARVAAEEGIDFYPFGDSIYLSDRVPARYISGPALPKEPLAKKETLVKPREITPGSFILKVSKDPDLKRRKKSEKRIKWKEEVKKERRKGTFFKGRP
jgi:putative RNA 2'-phosphotransferase